MWCDNQRRQNKLRDQGKKSSMTDERVAALNEVSFWWGWRIIPFEDRIEELKKFRDEHGTCRVTNSDGPEHHGLRDWLKAQRERYHAGFLGKDRKAVLEEVGFHFGARMPKWEDHFDMLLKYKQKHGHCNVSKDDENEHGDLVRWIKRQRALYTARIRGGIATGGEEDTPPKATMAARTKDFGLTDERLVKLEEVGFLFNAWDVKYSELVEYKRKYGSLPEVPVNVDSARKYARQDGVDDGQLVRWLANQRKNYPGWLAGRDTPLSDDRVIRLLKLGFEFEPPEANVDKGKADDKQAVESTWKKQLGVLRAYKELYGHVDVPHNFGMNRDLANWVQMCRMEYRALKDGKGKEKDKNQENSIGMTEQLAEELRELGLSLTKEEESWNAMLRELMAYEETHGTTCVQPGDRKYVALGQWVKEQRKEFRAWQDGKDSNLTESRIATMEEAGFPFEQEEADKKIDEKLAPEKKGERAASTAKRSRRGSKSLAVEKDDSANDDGLPAAADPGKKAGQKKRGSAKTKPAAKKEEDNAMDEYVKSKAPAKKKKKDEADNKTEPSKTSARQKKKDSIEKEATTPRTSARKKMDETDGKAATSRFSARKKKNEIKEDATTTTPRSSARKKMKDETDDEAAAPRTSARRRKADEADQGEAASPAAKKGGRQTRSASKAPVAAAAATPPVAGKRRVSERGHSSSPAAAAKGGESAGGPKHSLQRGRKSPPDKVASSSTTTATAAAAPGRKRGRTTSNKEKSPAKSPAPKRSRRSRS